MTDQCTACGGGPEIQSLVHPCGCGGGDALHIDCVGRWTPRRCPSCGGGFGWRAYLLAQRWIPPLLVLLIMFALWGGSVCLALVLMPPAHLAENNIFGARLQPTLPVYLLLGGIIFGVVSFFIAAATFIFHVCTERSPSDGSCGPGSSFIYVGDLGGGGGGDRDGAAMLALIVIVAAIGLAAAVFAIYWYVFEQMEDARRKGLVATLSKDGRVPLWALQQRNATGA